MSAIADQIDRFENDAFFIAWNTALLAAVTVVLDDYDRLGRATGISTLEKMTP